MKQATKDALLEFVGDRTDDEAISILETINDDGIDDGEDWHQKYVDNDKEWRERYTARFKEGGAPQSTVPPELEPEPDPEDEMKKLTIDTVLYGDNK
jgi:hypothetical protein